MAKEQSTLPIDINRAAGNTGELLSESAIANPILYSWQYLRNFMPGMQVFTYSGPGPFGDANSSSYDYINPNYDYEKNNDPCFEVILHSPPKEDTAHEPRQLYGAIIPWQVVPHKDRALDMTTVPATVTWESSRAGTSSEQTIYHTKTSSPHWWAARAWHEIGDVETLHLYNNVSPNLLYDSQMSSGTMIAWGNGGSTVGSMVTSSPSPYSGTYCLKVPYSGGVDSYVYPKVPGTPRTATAPTLPTATNRFYHLKGKAVGDGVSNPRIENGVTTLWAGSPSTSWQEFDFGFTSTAALLRFHCNGTGYTAFDNVELYERGTFQYDPPADGEFVLCKLRTNRIRPAALSIWQCPDHRLQDEQAVVLPRHVHAGKSVRGYHPDGDASLGTLIHQMGRGPYTDFNEDDVERVTRRCLFGWGHPTGVGTTSSSEVNIRNNHASWFKVRGRNLENYTSSPSVLAMPAVVAYASGASGGDPAYVKIYTSGGSNWTYTITDSGGLHGGASDGYIAFDPGVDTFRVTLQAPSSGAVWLKSLSIYEVGHGVY